MNYDIRLKTGIQVGVGSVRLEYAIYADGLLGGTTGTVIYIGLDAAKECCSQNSAITERMSMQRTVQDVGFDLTPEVTVRTATGEDELLGVQACRALRFSTTVVACGEGHTFEDCTRTSPYVVGIYSEECGSYIRIPERGSLPERHGRSKIMT